MTDDRTKDRGQGAAVYVVSIKRAAELLHVSDKTVQRRMKAGELEATTVAGKRAVRVRAEQLPPDAALDQSLDQTADSLDSTGLTLSADRTGDTRTGDTALATVPGRGAALVAAIVAEALHQQGQQRPAVAPDAKLMLTINEAVEYSGIGRAAINTAIRNGHIQAHRGLGRGRRIKRSDLEKWAAKM